MCTGAHACLHGAVAHLVALDLVRCVRVMTCTGACVAVCFSVL